MYRIPIIPAIFFALTSCNNDIFVDPIPDIGERHHTLSGNGGSCTLTIPFDGLQSVSLTADNDYSASAVYYGHDGDPLYGNFALDQVASIVFGSPRFAMRFDIDGCHVRATALDNTYPDTLRIYGRLHYEQASTSIDFSITPGKPIELVSLIYSMTTRPGSITKTSEPQRFTNQSNLMQNIIIYPYMEAKSNVEFYAEDPAVNDISGLLDVPLFRSGQWDMESGQKVPCIIGKRSQYTAAGTDSTECVTVEVAPGSTVTYQLVIDYATLDGAYWLETRMPNSGITNTTTGTISIHQPTGYKVFKR